MQNRPYKIISSKMEIQIDVDELPKLLESLSTGQPCFFRRGGFNPSFYVGVVKDEKRWSRFIDDIKYDDNKAELRLAGVPQLKSMFDETVLKLSAGK